VEDKGEAGLDVDSGDPGSVPGISETLGLGEAGSEGGEEEEEEDAPGSGRRPLQTESGEKLQELYPFPKGQEMETMRQTPGSWPRLNRPRRRCRRRAHWRWRAAVVAVGQLLNEDPVVPQASQWKSVREAVLLQLVV
jgi:hypothetical protein